jgi:hypothetical protein
MNTPGMAAVNSAAARPQWNVESRPVTAISDSALCPTRATSLTILAGR